MRKVAAPKKKSSSNSTTKKRSVAAILTVFTTIGLYAIAPLLIYQIHPTNTLAQWFSAVLLWVIGLIAYIFPIVRFVRAFRSNQKLETLDVLWSFLTWFIVVSLMLAGVWMSFVILDQSPGKNQALQTVANPFESYVLFFLDIWITTLFILTSTTAPSTFTQPLSSLARIWALIIGLHGWLFLGLLLFVLTSLISDLFTQRSKRVQSLYPNMKSPFS